MWVDKREINEKKEKLLKALEDYYDDKDKNRTHVPGKDIIQHAGPYLRKEEFSAAINTLLKEWMVQGENAQKFEKEFSGFIDKKYSVAVSSGTAALDIAIKALDIKKNDEVLIPNFTIISNALAVIRQQAKPVLIDCNLKDWNIKIEDIEKNISKKTKYSFRKPFYKCEFNYKRTSKFAMEIFD